MDRYGPVRQFSGFDWYPVQKFSDDDDSDSWANNEFQKYRDSQVDTTTTPGELVITANIVTENGEVFIHSGRVVMKDTTRDELKVEPNKKITISYTGKVEYNDDENTKKLLWPAFWLLGTQYWDDNNGDSWPRVGEIDVMEWVSRYDTDNTTDYTSSIHIGNTFDDRTVETVSHITGEEYTYNVSNLHTYTTNIYCGENLERCDIEFILYDEDDVERSKKTIYNVDTKILTNSSGGDKYFGLLMNLAVGGDLTEYTNPNDEINGIGSFGDPATMTVTKVSVESEPFKCQNPYSIHFGTNTECTEVGEFSNTFLLTQEWPNVDLTNYGVFMNNVNTLVGKSSNYLDTFTMKIKGNLATGVSSTAPPAETNIFREFNEIGAFNYEKVNYTIDLGNSSSFKDEEVIFFIKYFTSNYGFLGMGYNVIPNTPNTLVKGTIPFGDNGNLGNNVSIIQVGIMANSRQDTISDSADYIVDVADVTLEYVEKQSSYFSFNRIKKNTGVHHSVGLPVGLNRYMKRRTGK